MSVAPIPNRHDLCVDEGFKHGMFQHRHEILSFLYFLESTLPPNAKLGTVVEIGSHRGGTSAMFCQAGANVYSIDLPTGPWGGIGEDSARSRDEFLTRQFPTTYHPIWGDSHDQNIQVQLGRLVPRESVDLLFIDGDHSYLGVREDYKMYWQLVRPGGVIAFHDINDTAYHRDRGVVVSDFWKQLEGEKHEFTINAEWGGIGALRK